MELLRMRNKEELDSYAVSAEKDRKKTLDEINFIL
jgi:hypothetical protein